MSTVNVDGSDVVTDPAGATGRLANWLVSTTLDDIPDRVIDRGKILMLDGFACGLLASRVPWSERAVRAVSRMEGGGGDASVWGWDLRLPSPAAALLNGTFVQGFELDDYHSFGPLHSESCVLPSVLASAESIGGVNGRRLLEACILGFEVGPRIGIAMGGLGLVSRGFHCGAVFGTMSSAAGVGKLRGLNPAQLEDAFGIAATQSSGLMSAQYEAMVKRMHSGFATRSGLYAVNLAAEGFTGIKRVIEREYGGLASTFSNPGEIDLEQVTARIGEFWEVERIAIKPPYSCMGGLHTSIDAIRALRNRRPFTAADVKSVNVEVGHAMYHHGGWRLERPAEVIGAQMNIGYAIAVTILDGDAFVPQFDPSRINRDDVWQLIDKIHITWDPSIDEKGRGARWTARIRITFEDGSTDSIEQVHPWGGSDRPLTRDEALQKFWRMARCVMPDSRAEKLRDLILRIEDCEDIGELVELLAAPVQSPFAT